MTVDYSSKEYLNKLDAYWRAANYVSVGQLLLKKITHYYVAHLKHLT